MKFSKDNPWGSTGPSFTSSSNEKTSGSRQRRGPFPPLFPGFPSQLPLGKIFLGIILLWLSTGIYQVQPDEQGVVLRFGSYVRTAEPGLNYHLPYPFETVFRPKVTRVNRIDIGVTDQESGTGENSMLTGDENIININFTVFWSIKNARLFLFGTRNPEAIIKAAAESAMREAIGQTPLADILAEKRGQIEEQVKLHLQTMMNAYGTGVEIAQVQLQRADPPDEVLDAFRDVQRARADQERMKNDAEAYRNKIIPEARGDAERLIQEAEGYKQKVIADAQGQVSRFQAILIQFLQAPEITKTRLYLEAMEHILKPAHKIILDQGSQGVLPYLPLNELESKASEPKAQSSSSSLFEGLI